MHSYQAITTKYIGPTNTRGSRIKASAAAGSITISYDDSLNTEHAHTKAAMALVNKFGWPGTYYIGGMPNDKGYVFVSGESNTVAFTSTHQSYRKAS